MLKLKLQYFDHLMQTDDSLEKSLMLGKNEGRRRRGHQRRRQLDSFTGCNEHELGQPQEMVRTGRPDVLQSMGSQRVRHDWETEQQQRGILRRSCQHDQHCLSMHFLITYISL